MQVFREVAEGEDGADGVTVPAGGAAGRAATLEQSLDVSFVAAHADRFVRPVQRVAVRNHPVMAEPGCGHFLDAVRSGAAHPAGLATEIGRAPGR